MGRAGGPPRTSPGREPRRRSSEGSPDRAIGLPDVARLHVLRRPELVEGPRRKEERTSRGLLNAARGADGAPFLLCAVFLKRPAPSSRRGGTRSLINPGPESRRAKTRDYVTERKCLKTAV